MSIRIRFAWIPNYPRLKTRNASSWTKYQPCNVQNVYHCLESRRLGGWIAGWIQYHHYRGHILITLLLDCSTTKTPSIFSPWFLSRTPQEPLQDLTSIHAVQVFLPWSIWGMCVRWSSHRGGFLKSSSSSCKSSSSRKNSMSFSVFNFLNHFSQSGSWLFFCHITRSGSWSWSGRHFGRSWLASILVYTMDSCVFTLFYEKMPRRRWPIQFTSVEVLRRYG